MDRARPTAIGHRAVYAKRRLARRISAQPRRAACAPMRGERDPFRRASRPLILSEDAAELQARHTDASSGEPARGVLRDQP